MNYSSEIIKKKYFYTKLQNVKNPFSLLLIAKMPNMPASCQRVLEREIIKSKNDKLFYPFSKILQSCDKHLLYNNIDKKNKELKTIFILDYLLYKPNDLCYYANLDIDICTNILKNKLNSTEYLYSLHNAFIDNVIHNYRENVDNFAI